MMRLRVFNIILVLLILAIAVQGQNLVKGVVYNSTNNNVLQNVELYDNSSGYITKTNQEGAFKFYTKKEEIDLVFFLPEFNYSIIKIQPKDSIYIEHKLVPLQININEIEINRSKINFEKSRLSDVVKTEIYAGKKSEVVSLENGATNLATNNARQIYSQVSGLNIYQDDAGLQLNIGGRGLDPNRTANFNTRQNGYDISADVLGYPESYYTPAPEGVKQIQIIRGAASLQYGTQFGGLLNFIMKSPNQDKKINIVNRNTLGSNSLYTNFTSLSINKKKLGYYGFLNYKEGDGFRKNSEFSSRNFYNHISYTFNKKTKISTEITCFNYLARQAGGLTDEMFLENPLQSTRERNWFKVNWILYNTNLYHSFNKNTKLSVNLYGLSAFRYALGFRTNRSDQPDILKERDLIKSRFNNIASEVRILNNHKLLTKRAIGLIGAKIYKSNNKSQQGPGSSASIPDFEFYTNEYPYYSNQSDYKLPNSNTAVFGEEIIYITDKMSIVPGFRYEYIKTEAIGDYTQINIDGAGNPIWDTIIYEEKERTRDFLLFGCGIVYKLNSKNQIYANLTQNYKSITFSDISIVNPAFMVDEDIEDEKGYTLDVGFRGKKNKILSYNINGFYVAYKDRIGFIERNIDGNVKSERTNVGDAIIFGLESFIFCDISKLINLEKFQINSYINSSIINSSYIRSKENGITGNNVEFVPKYNTKMGLSLAYQKLVCQIHFSHVAKQYTDATNAYNNDLGGIIGLIPTYNILDISSNYSFKRCKIEFGINNILNKKYFTRRATGYPGPGIIPDPVINGYVTFEIKI